jgi:hypothetical protein
MSINGFVELKWQALIGIDCTLYAAELFFEIAG